MLILINFQGYGSPLFEAVERAGGLVSSHPLRRWERLKNRFTENHRAGAWCLVRKNGRVSVGSAAGKMQELGAF